VVLLSPGGTSFDEFIDFEARGEAFKKWVMELV
jgi:UDP-N-acetylmuramoylalanine--D-glutamate ligase